MKKTVLFLSWIGVIIVIGFVSFVLSMLISSHETLVPKSIQKIPDSTQTIPKQSLPSTTDTLDPEASSTPSSAPSVSEQPLATSPSEVAVQKETSTDKAVISKDDKSSESETVQKSEPVSPATLDNNSVNKSPNASDYKVQKEQSGTIIRSFRTIQQLAPTNTNTIPLQKKEQQAPAVSTDNQNSIPLLKQPRSNIPPSPPQDSEQVACSDVEKMVGDKNNDLEMGWAKVGYEVLQLEQQLENFTISLREPSN